MEPTNPILIIENNPEDSELIIDILRTLGLQNKIECLPDGHELLTYLRENGERPFLIIANINLPVVDGRGVKKHLNNSRDLQLKATPFLFFTTSFSKDGADEAYSLGAHGYFKRDGNRERMQEMLRSILEYWGITEHPDTSDGA